MRIWSSTSYRNYEATSLPFPPDLPLAVMDITIGCLYMFSGPTRIHNSSLNTARQILWFVPGDTAVRLWGALFFLVGVCLLVAIYHRRTYLLNITQVIGAPLFFMWSMMYFISGIQLNSASFVGVPVFLYFSYRHSFAPVRTLHNASGK